MSYGGCEIIRGPCSGHDLVGQDKGVKCDSGRKEYWGRRQGRDDCVNKGMNNVLGMKIVTHRLNVDRARCSAGLWFNTISRWDDTINT